MVRWIRGEHIHPTLKFLGDVSRADSSKLIEALRRACTQHAPFRLGLSGIGCFPTTENPRIIWMGVNGQVATLLRLQKSIEKETGSFGAHSEQRIFQPHLTIGRVRAAGNAAHRLGTLVESTIIETLCGWTVRRVELIESELRPDGARHTQP